LERRIQLWAYGLFVASGATGLIYEVTWFRNLSLIFGASFEATSIVLASYMAGLSLGGYSFGRIASRVARPLRLYGLLELGVGAFALVLPALLRGVDSVYVSVAAGEEDLGPALPAIRAVMAFAILVVPTFFMGATLPVVTRFLVRAEDEFGVRLSWLYGSNTFGAVLGTLLAGFVMIPALGVWQTQLCAVFINASIGIIALWVDRRLAPLPTQDSERAGAGEESSVAMNASERRVLELVFWGTAISGFASLALEVLWTRAISVTAGSSTYSFSIMLAAFLTGIWLGSWLHALLPFRRFSIGVQFGVVTLMAGLWSLLASTWIPLLPELGIELNLFLFDDLSRIRPLTTLLLAYLIMLVPCLFIGIAFPLANQARARLAIGFARPVGDTLGLNTLGSISGSLLAGFVLIPFVGLQRSMLAASSLYIAYSVIVLGASLATRDSSRAFALRAGAAFVAIFVLALPFLAPSWSNSVLGGFSNNQLMQYVDAEGVVDVEIAIDRGTVQYYREGRGATVSVIEQDGYRSISVNGKIVASDDPADLRTQYMLAHIPILMHPDPRSALVVGMGAGTTLGAVMSHDGLEEVALAEIEEAVLGASPYFADANGRPLEDERLRVYLEDGRNFLKMTDRTFDVITADPIHPWTRGSGYLYTEEYYRLAASRLREGGIMCQWLPVADLTPEDFKSVVATFARVFPHTLFWHSTAAILIGSEAPLSTTVEGLETRMSQPRVRRELESLGIDNPLSFLAELRLDDSQVRQYAGDAVINTDDNLYLEFSSPLAIGRAGQVRGVVEEVYGFVPGEAPLPKDDPRIETLRIYQSAKAATIRAENALLSSDPRIWNGALRSLQQLVTRVPRYRPPAFVLADQFAHRSQAFVARGQMELAGAQARLSLELVPNQATARRALGVSLLRLGRIEEAVVELESAREIQPRHWATFAALGEVYLRAERFDDAETALRQGLEILPDEPSMTERLGRLLAERDGGEL
jgi:spermidine synthase